MKLDYHTPETTRLPDLNKEDTTTCYLVTTDSSGQHEREIYGIEDLLDTVGDEGWDLTWSDGTNFIFKRPADAWTNICLFTVVEKITSKPLASQP